MRRLGLFQQPARGFGVDALGLDELEGEGLQIETAMDIEPLASGGRFHCRFRALADIKF